MNYRQAMKELKAAGTAQNRKVYARHGIPQPMFGVSSANLLRIILDADDLWSSVLASNDVVALLVAEVGGGDGVDRVIGKWDFAVTTDGNDVTANYDQTLGIWTAA